MCCHEYHEPSSDISENIARDPEGVEPKERMKKREGGGVSPAERSYSFFVFSPYTTDPRKKIRWLSESVFSNQSKKLLYASIPLVYNRVAFSKDEAEGGEGGPRLVFWYIIILRALQQNRNDISKKERVRKSFGEKRISKRIATEILEISDVDIIVFRTAGSYESQVSSTYMFIYIRYIYNQLEIS